VEFTVQYLVLAHAAQHPALQPNRGNIQLLRIAEQCGLLPPGLGQRAGDAYRNLRRMQHKARLDEASTATSALAVTAEREAVLALWQAIFAPGQAASSLAASDLPAA
jgi:glutamate-ammonia-ligase adenylyltransferase